MTQLILAELLFPPSPFLWPALLLLLISGSMVALSYRRASLARNKKWAAGGLKILGFALLAFCLLEPVWTGQTAEKGANHFVILADNGMGLHVKDPAYAHEPRSQFMANLLQEDQPNVWLQELNDNFKLDRFVFDTRLQRTEDFSDLDHPGQGSALFSALDILATRYQDQPLAGVVILTDGNATDRPENLEALRDFAPIYPVVIGSDKDLVDLAVQQVTATATAFEDAPITIKADFTSAGYQDTAIEACLMDSASNVVERIKVKVTKDQEQHSVRFRVRPDTPGISHYQLVLNSLGTQEEATLHNNSYSVTVDQGSGKNRILYVCGRPNWEYKFLRRAMEDDEQTQLVGLIRIAKREPKFEFRGRDGEGSNPLFRGFGKTDEEAEFDQPVFVRMNTRDSDELANGFPRQPEDLFSYSAIVLDDLEADFFTQDQMNLLERFVAHRGGGLLMLGGLETFQQGGYEKTLLSKMSPVYLDRQTEAISYQPAQWDLTREGWLTPWIRLRETEDDDKIRVSEMPPFKVLNRVKAIKPGARVMSTADINGTAYPALAVQHYGQGQTGAFMIGDFWRWGFAHESFQEDMAKSWRQIMRWLVSEVPKRLTTEVEAGQAAHQAHQIRVRALDARHEPIDQALVQVKITHAVTNELTLTAIPAEDERGVYTVSFMPPSDGPYEAEALIKDDEGIESGKMQAGWSVNRRLSEFARLKPDRALLEELANVTSGKVFQPEALNELNTLLDQREMPMMETWTRPAWHTPFLFLLALVCFIGEWFIRRRSHLA